MYSDTRFYKNVLEIRDMYRDAPTIMYAVTYIIAVFAFAIGAIVYIIGSAIEEREDTRDWERINNHTGDNPVDIDPPYDSCDNWHEGDF